MGITIAGQTWTFLGGVLLGAALGVCYDLFRVARLAIPHSGALVAVEDLLFFCICAAATFLYLLGTAYGEVRLFVLVGEGVGFSLYHCTLGAVTIRVAGVLVRALGRLFSGLRRLVWQPLVRLALWVLRPASKMAKILANCRKSGGKNSRIPLQTRRGLLYNLKNSFVKNRQKKFEKSRSGLQDEERQKQKNESGG